MKQISLFAEENRFEKLSELGDCLERLKIIDRMSFMRFLGLGLNEKIKNGEIPEEWKKNPHKMAQKDIDARWTKKRDETHYGYKDHVKVDADSKLILDYVATPF